MEITTYALIRHLHLSDGHSRRAVARLLKISSKTVRRALSMDRYEPPKGQKRGSVLDIYKPAIKKLLEEYPTLGGMRVMEEIKKQGYRGGITTVRDYLRQIRPRKKPVFATLHFEPAEAFQVDWASIGTIKHEGTMHRLYAFLMVACYSRMLYVEFTLSMKTEEFLRCHQNAFRFYGGVFRHGIYDNLKSVVLSRIGNVIHFHPLFLEFSTFYLFEPRVCRPRKPQEKGQVENAVRYLRSSFLSGRSFSSFSALQPAMARWLEDVANVRIHRTTGKRPVDLFEKEQSLLRKLPPAPMDVRMTRTVKITQQCRARFEGNTYSVPPDYASQVLTLKASFKEVTLYHGEREVARHSRTFSRGKDVVAEAHETALRESRRRVDQSLMERDFRGLSAKAGAYLEGLCSSTLQPTLQMRKILQLVHLYGREEVAGAVERAFSFEAFGFDYIQNIVLQERNRKNLPPESSLILPSIHKWQYQPFQERDLNDYEVFLEDKNENDEEKEKGRS